MKLTVLINLGKCKTRANGMPNRGIKQSPATYNIMMSGS